MQEVLDFITPPGTPEELLARGITGVLVYIAPFAWHWTKAAHVEWVRHALEVGLQVGFLFETNTHQMEGGFAAGQQHGQAVRQALSDYGFAQTEPVTFADDESVPPSLFFLRADYMRGVASAVPCIRGYYGEGAMIEYLAGRGLIAHGFQSESTGFLGNQAPTPHTSLRQVYGKFIPGVGGSYDVDDVYQLDWGQLNQAPAFNLGDMNDMTLHTDDVHPGLDGNHPRECSVQDDGSVIFGNGCSFVEEKPVIWEGLTVIASPMPPNAGWKWQGATDIWENGKRVGVRAAAISPNGQWNPYVWHYAA